MGKVVGPIRIDPMRRDGSAVSVWQGDAWWNAVCPRESPEVVVERMVLLHDHEHMPNWSGPSHLSPQWRTREDTTDENDSADDQTNCEDQRDNPSPYVHPPSPRSLAGLRQKRRESEERRNPTHIA